MSDDRSMITQFEAAQVARFDELYSETLKNSKLKIKNINSLNTMCKRMLELDAEKQILEPIFDEQTRLLHRLSRSRTKKSEVKIRNILGLRSRRRYMAIFNEQCDLYYALNFSHWTAVRNDLLRTIISRTISAEITNNAAYFEELNRLEPIWTTTIVENAKLLIADVNSEIAIKKQQAEERINPGDTKTLAAKYHADPTPDNAATYAEVIRALQVDCPICLDTEDFFKGKAMPQCRHVFHEVCLCEWVKKATTCPLCRTPITDVFMY
jgi:hypothetical protein